MHARSILAVGCVLFLVGRGLPAQADEAATGAAPLSYPIVDTGQDRCYDARGEIGYPSEGQPFFGQDAHYQGNAPRYRELGDGTVLDEVTRLVWQKTPGPTKPRADPLRVGDLPAADAVRAGAASGSSSCRQSRSFQYNPPELR